MGSRPATTCRCSQRAAVRLCNSLAYPCPRRILECAAACLCGRHVPPSLRSVVVTLASDFHWRASVPHLKANAAARYWSARPPHRSSPPQNDRAHQQIHDGTCTIQDQSHRQRRRHAALAHHGAAFPAHLELHRHCIHATRYTVHPHEEQRQSHRQCSVPSRHRFLRLIACLEQGACTVACVASAYVIDACSAAPYRHRGGAESAAQWLGRRFVHFLSSCCTLMFRRTCMHLCLYRNKSLRSRALCLTAPSMRACAT
jgi:hypothetical protein